MREQLEKCPQRDRMYFESDDGRYLQVLRSGKDSFIGKILEPATEARAVDDIRRNVWSLLQKVCPGRRDEGEIRIYALDADEPTFVRSSPALSRDPYSGEADDDDFG